MSYTAESIARSKRREDLRFILGLGCVTAGLGFLLLPWLWAGWAVEDAMKQSNP